MTSPLSSTLALLSVDPDYVNLRTLTGVSVDLRYASEDNFMSRNVYGEFNEPFLHRLAAEKLAHAAQLLRKTRAGWHLHVFDALRPRSVQRLLWAHVAGTPQEGYVANPDRGSMHNYGCAVDLTVVDDHGRELDMGTAFDAFHPLSQPRLEEEHLRSGALSRAQADNRLILREAMTEAGFLQLPHEWWHYDAFAPDEVRARFRMIE